MMSTTERLDALERDLASLRDDLREYLRHPVRDELLGMRDVHGLRLGAIEARLTSIERNVSDTESWMVGRFDDLDQTLREILSRLT